MKTRGQKQQPVYAYSYKKDQILGQCEKEKPVLYKVLEDMETNDHQSSLRVVKLEEQKKQKDGKVVYQETKEILLPVKGRLKVVENVEVISIKSNAKSRTSVTSIKQVLAATKQQKKQVSSERKEEVEELHKKCLFKKLTGQEVQSKPVKQEVQKKIKRERKLIEKEQIILNQQEESNNKYYQQQPSSDDEVMNHGQKIDFREDAQKFLESLAGEFHFVKKDLRYILDVKYPPESEIHVAEDNVGPYSVLITKMDFENGDLPQCIFQKYQLLTTVNECDELKLVDSQKRQDLRRREYGMTESTNYGKMMEELANQEAIEKFSKIFYDQTGGNDWRQIMSGEKQFIQKPNMFNFFDMSKIKFYNKILTPLDFNNDSSYQFCALNKAVQRVIFQFSQVEFYQHILEQFHIDSDMLPLERLDRNELQNAKKILNEITGLVKNLNYLKFYQVNDLDPWDSNYMEKLTSKREKDEISIQHISEEIQDKSFQFYEIIRVEEWRSKKNALPSLIYFRSINARQLLVEILRNIEISSKILMGAHFEKIAINPLTYCFNALNVIMRPCLPEHPVYKLIVRYINQSYQQTIKNIFWIQRKDEAERFQQNKKYNRLFLWHHFENSNLMGILATGLTITSPWVRNNDQMFGQGIYFTDMFKKSFDYSQDWLSGWSRLRNPKIKLTEEQDEIQRYHYILLCEVAVGTSLELFKYEYINNLPKQFQSVKGCGKTGPDYQNSVNLANGCTVPVGPCINYPPPKQEKNHKKQPKFQLEHNEYVVYDESKVMIRYMVQIDTKITVDKY